MKLLCVGDIALASHNDYNPDWLLPRDIVNDKEARMLFNWEIPVGDTVNPIPRTSGPRVLGEVKGIKAIHRWAPGFAALATNHILDGGEMGLESTLTSLKKEGFLTVGAGTTREEISRPLIWKTADGKLAVLNWVFPETHPDYMQVPGPNCWPGLEEGRQVVQELKKQVDWVLVFPHWSDECFPYPTPSDREIARGLVEAGADIIIGHHPHVVRGCEMINGKPVFYSLGNFYFSNIRDQRGNWIVRPVPRNREALAIKVSFFRGQAPRIEALSYWQGKKETVPDPFHRAVRRMKNSSKPLMRLSGSDYSDWYQKSRAAFNRWEFRVAFSLPQKDWKDILRYPFSFFEKKRRRAKTIV